MRQIHQFKAPGQPQGVRATLAIVTLGVMIQGFLRILQLARPAPYGEPFVEKLEWYLFHAIAYDSLYTIPLFIPFLVFFWMKRDPISERANSILFKCMIFLQACILSFSALDHEMMRFLSVHGSISQFRTYIGLETMRDLPELLSTDAGGVGLPIFTVFGSGIFALLTGHAAIRNFQNRKRSIARWVLGLVILCLVSYSLLFHIWKGGFRLLKLRPLVASFVLELNGHSQNSELNSADRAKLANQMQALWSSRSDGTWVFPDPEAPFYRVPASVICQSTPGPECEKDKDGDGFTGRDDCDDSNGQVYPGAEDIPGNGIDEDCSGMDSKPWNIVLIFMESHRSLNVGHLKNQGALHSSTPFLDELAQQPSSRSFSRYQTNGVPTIAAFMNAHCSVYSKSVGHAATDNTQTRVHCLPQILRDKGFHTRFFTATAPDWDNQTFWLSQWYDETEFSRERQTDLTMFTHMGKWMRENLTATEPFFVGAITKSNHFPFNAIEDMTPEERAGTPNNMDATMRYSDRSLKAFFTEAREAPWFDNTVFLITADHGFNWGEKGFYRLGDPLHRPSSWVPLVVVGDHPKLKDIESLDSTLSSHVDLAPTIIDLLGIDVPNAFVGHSLLDPAFRASPYVYASHGAEIAWETPSQRNLIPHENKERKDGEEQFMPDDFLMEHPLPLDPQFKEFRSVLYAIQALTDDAFSNDRVLPIESHIPSQMNAEGN